MFTKVVSGRDLMMENIESMVGTAINIIPQRIRLTNKIKKDIQSVYAHNVKNMLYDKIDFYQSDICGRKLMDEIQTMIVFTTIMIRIPQNLSMNMIKIKMT